MRFKVLLSIILLAGMFLAIPTDVQAVPPDSYGPYTITVFSASVSFIRDTLSIAEVIPAASGITLRNYWITMLYSVNPALINQSCQILKHTAGTSTLICDTTGGVGGSADIGFSADYAVNDIILITQYPPAGAKIRGTVTATKLATGVLTRDGLLYINNSADSAAADAGIIDSIRFEMSTTRGIAVHPTGVFHANGVGIAEDLAWLQDTTRAMWSHVGLIKTAADSIAGTSYGAVGSQWAQAAASYAAGVSHEQVLMDLQDQSDTMNTIKLEYIEQMAEDTRDSLEDANDHLQTLLGVTTGFIQENLWKTVEVIVNFAAAGAWEEAATTHELFTVTGYVEFEISAFCSTNVATTSSDSLWLFLGEAGATGYRAVSLLGDDADAGENIIPTVHSPGYIWTAAGLTTNAGGAWKGTIFMGKDIGYSISDHDFTGGIIVFYCRWRPITTGGTVAAGAGGAL